MLAQSFQSAADLGISEEQKDALIKTLKLLETGKLVHIPLHNLRERWMVVAKSGGLEFTGGFNMHVVVAEHDCGSAGCIYGTAKMISGVSPPVTDAAMDLFCGSGRPDHRSLDSLTIDESARALRSYLTHGDAKWAEAVSA